MWETVTDPDAWVGGGRVGTLSAAPVDVVRVLGDATIATPSGDYKVDREWVVSHPEFGALTVYAYKATSLYDPEGPSPDAFWKQTQVERLSVGGHNSAAAEHFVEWFHRTLAELPKGDGYE